MSDIYTNNYEALPFTEIESTPSYDASKIVSNYYDEERCNACPGLEKTLCLIDSMVNDINELETELVRTRRALSHFHPPYEKMILRSDIYSGLAGRHYDDSLYRIYMKWVGGEDPMESDTHIAELRNAAGAEPDASADGDVIDDFLYRNRSDG